jgi:type II secretory pathway component PulF
MMETISMPAYGQFLYLGVTAMVTCLVMAFMATSIVPTMEQMFEEFALAMPLRWVFKFGPAVWVLVLLGAIAVILLPILNRARKLGVRLPGWIPMTPKMAEKRAEVLFGLADGLDAGWPLGKTMALGHRVAQSGWERRALERAMRDVQKGIEPIESIHRIGWIDSTEAAWLDGANPARAGELLRGFASQSVRDAHENIRWIMAWLFPIVVLLLGIAVLLFAVAFFGSLAGLIRDLS